MRPARWRLHLLEVHLLEAHRLEKEERDKRRAHEGLDGSQVGRLENREDQGRHEREDGEREHTGDGRPARDDEYRGRDRHQARDEQCDLSHGDSRAERPVLCRDEKPIEGEAHGGEREVGHGTGKDQPPSEALRLVSSQARERPL